MFIFWCPKWGITIFGDIPGKDLFSEGLCGQANEGQLLHGWEREIFEMIDECWQAHTEEDDKANFSKHIYDHDHFFGKSAIIERLMLRANEIHYPSRLLALDEEINSILGKLLISQYGKDKKKAER